MSRRELLGVLAAGLSSLIGGTAVVATRFVIADTDPATLGLARYGLGCVCLLLVIGWAAKKPPRRDLVPITFLGILFFAAFPWLFNTSLAWTTAAHGSLALATMPLLTLVVAALVGAEQLTLLKFLGVAAAILGVAVALFDRLALPGLDQAWRGDLIMVGTALCGAVYNVLARPYLKRYPALVFTAYAMLGGTAALAVMTAISGQPTRLLSLGPASWFSILYLGIVGAAITFWLWSVALERITPTRVAITVALNPVTSMAFGAILLGEPLTWRLAISLGAILIGIVLANWRGRETAAPVAVATR